jgi:thiamine biosynthesis lipoprotein
MGATGGAAKLVRVSRAAMGTLFEIVLCGEDAGYLRQAASEALDEVERLEARLSHYRADSEIRDLNLRAAHGPVRLEPSVFRLMERALAYSRATDGAFDVTAGPLIRAWGFFRGQGRLASAEALAEARDCVGGHLVELEEEARTARFLRPGVEIHLGAIGKGYAVDRAVETLRELGIGSALVHGGTSTVYALGTPPGEEAWEVGLCDPENRKRRLGIVRLKDRALSTSGDYEQFFEVEGRRYSHILDPRTGAPAAGTRSATVLAGSAEATDALSTAAFVLGVEGCRELIARFPGTGAVLVPEGNVETGPVLLGAVDFRPDSGIIESEKETEL